MIQARWTAIKEEILSFPAKERFFAFCCMLCGFFICADYAIVRPVSNSLFIHAYGSAFFPYAWLAMVPLNLLIVSLYSKFLPRFGARKMFLCILSSIAAVNLFCAFFIKELSFLPFFLYIWKEVYVMLLFQQLWSQIHSSCLAKRAKYLYGVLFGIGGIGGIVGSMLPGFFAVEVGSEKLLFFNLPLYLLLGGSFLVALKQVGAQSFEQKDQESFFEGAKLVFRSKLLLAILGLVVCMQISSTLIEYQFNTSLESALQGKDVRTEYFGRVMAIVQCATTIMQFVGSFLLVHLLGVRRSHFFIPLLLCMNALAFLSFPLFGVVTLSFITIKALDFSLFGVIKEMLYLETKPDEKFRAKAFIDVFAYRSSKALASLVILGVQVVIGARALSALSWGCVTLFVLWMGVVGWMVRPAKQEA